MVTIRYTEWDGSQRGRLSTDRMLEELAKHLSSTDDMQQALEQLMRQGLGDEDNKLKGLDDLVRDRLPGLFGQLAEQPHEPATRAPGALARVAAIRETV